MTLQEVKQFFKDNAGTDEVKSYLSELSKVSPDAEEQIIKNFKNSQDYKSEVDRTVTRAIQTYNEKTVPTLIEKAVNDKIAEINPAPDPRDEKWQKELARRDARDAERDKKEAEKDKRIIQKEVNNTIQSLLDEKKIPIKHAKLVPVNINDFKIEDIDDEQSLREKLLPGIEDLSAALVEAEIRKAEQMQMAGATRPVNSNSSPVGGQLTEAQLKALPFAERVKAEKEGRTNQLLGRQ